MYQKIISKMGENNVMFEQGLSHSDIDEIQRTYEIIFPQELVEFYTMALPVSKGFYNWKDFSSGNIEYIKSVIKRPEKDLLERINEIYWCGNWGDEPSEGEEKVDKIKHHLKMAPQLIPIFEHRYLPAYANSKSNPIFSVYGTDIIYYGDNLLSYLQIEFGIKDYNDVDYSLIPHIPFWTDLL